MAKLNNTLITGSLRITDDLSLSGVLTTNSISAATLAVSGASTFGGAITVNATTDSTSTSTGSLIVKGGIAAAKQLRVGTALTVGSTGTFTGAVTINSTTESSSTGTGALIVKGGAGVAKNLYVGGNTVITGNLTVNGTTTTVESTNLAIEDNLITLAKDNTAILTSPSGIVVPKYDGTNYGALAFTSDGIAYVGDVTLNSSGQIDTANSGWLPIVVRSGLDSTKDNFIVKWDDTSKAIIAATANTGTVWNDYLKYVKGINTNNKKTLASLSSATPLAANTSTYHQLNKISTYGIPLLKYSSVATSGTTYTYTVVNADGTTIALEDYDNFILDINKTVSSTATVKITYASKTYTLVESAVSTGSSFTNLDLTYPVLCKVISSTQIAIVGQISGKTGSTNTDSKIYLVGATSQTNNTNTYSDSEVYTTNGTLTTKEVEVGGGSVNMRYDSTAKALRFVFE